mmetsp:Transcript_657/g.1189  ORF Transcript_657/g.1189 Transcript_657/m.1189 type:complete len:133 (-) Transcript_657:664-1062(-)
MVSLSSSSSLESVDERALLMSGREKDRIQNSHSNVTTSETNSKESESVKLLKDIQIISFLVSLDGKLQRSASALNREQLDRLDTLYAQATSDNCEELLDIVDYLQHEHWKVQAYSKSAGPSNKLLSKASTVF